MSVISVMDTNVFIAALLRRREASHHHHRRRSRCSVSSVFPPSLRTAGRWCAAAQRPAQELQSAAASAGSEQQLVPFSSGLGLDRDIIDTRVIDQSAEDLGQN